MLNPTFLLVALAGLGFLIIVHEAGHYFVARWCKMSIERFSIGFGPAILKKRSRKTGTTFQIAPIPFGGFVEIRGMNIAEDIDPEDRTAYPNRPVWQRFLTIFAGPATNYLAALLLAFALYTCHGRDIPAWYGVADVVEGYDAATKLKAGDRILEVDGAELRYRPDSSGLTDPVNAAKGAPVRVKILRDGETQLVTLTPRHVNEATLHVREHLSEMAKLAPSLEVFARAIDRRLPDPVWRVGVRQEIQYRNESLALGDAVRKALWYPVVQTQVIGSSLYNIVFGEEKADPGGPIRIVEEIYKAFVAGIVPGVQLMMMLSVYLGLFNLLPIPALDGGRLVFLIYEMVTRRRANPKIETMVHMAGIMALGVVMLLVLYIDLKRFIP